MKLTAFTSCDNNTANHGNKKEWL